MSCGLSIVIGSDIHFSRIQHFMFTPSLWKIEVSTRPKLASRTTPKLRYSRVLVHDAHLRALDYLVETDKECAFIFEDDVIPSPFASFRKLQNLMSRLPPDWSYVNFGRCFSLCANEECYTDGLVRYDRSLCRHAYAVRIETARSLLQNTRSLSKAGDITWRDFLGKHHGNTTFSTVLRWYDQDRMNYKSRNGRRDNLRECEPFSPISERCLP